MRKAEYIEKYGEDAWKIHLQRRNEINKKYRKKTGYGTKWAREHYVKKEDYIAQYGEDAWKEYLKKRKKYSNRYYVTHKEEIIEKQREYMKGRVEERKNYMEEYNKEYRVSKEYRASDLCSRYRQMDKEKFCGAGDVFPQWVLSNILSSKCIYCGDSNWKHLGCDRIDNSKPHDIDNLVCACGICNIERADRYTVEEFIEYRKTHPRDEEPKKLQEIVEVNGKKVIRKVL